MTELDEIKRQSFNNYILAVSEIIRNNTISLIEDDIMSLIKKPPLDSMDVIKNKFLSVAKKKDIVLNTEIVDELLLEYRTAICNDILFIQDFRVNNLIQDIESFSPKKEYDIIRITKKQLSVINKKINSHLKKVVSEDISKYLIENISVLFFDESCFQDIYEELSKYFRITYQKQFMENINLKILVKDTTLINGVKEQGERYIFTKMNSRINNL
ncbi:MAG: hypothetical protein HFJ38_00215 [Bacilli bacterium]|nr:hypothetical protein [Bacilli bacterium]